ncbi:Uncharacterised protein [Pseudomonas luteola]|uniref:DUF2190 family protein n=1 Tax=Pseudomonas luteola TaxID=47886 RepID=A0A2X2CPE4_PSELU|nr:hypothetical protein [Pseudomonas luteola]SPZ07506.1 Uncharacterised protein [Pseudomonas luteola]
MAIQTSYSENIRAGVPGALVDMIPKTLLSRNVEDAAGIAFGVPVYQGARDKGVTATTGTAATFVGFTVMDRSVAVGSKFSQYESARVMTKGALWITAPAAVTAGAAVVIGGVTIPGARYDTSAAANQIVQVRLG